MPQTTAGETDQMTVGPTSAIAQEDILRAQGYRMLAHFLSGPPSQADLDQAAGLKGNDTTFGRALSTFAKLSAKTPQSAAAEEYQDLFIGVGRGELVPYGSYYLTGFLQEKPLAKLRQDMEELGLERDPAVQDPEDHVASLLEIMAGLIDGSLSPVAETGTPLSEQKQFYNAHLGGWIDVFFRDLESAKSSVLYAALGALGRAFLEIEEQGFEMV